jgi:hypothetical protein
MLLLPNQGVGPPEEDGKCTAEDLSPEELAAARAFQTWFVETYVGGDDCRFIKVDTSLKSNQLLDVFDQFDVNSDGFLSIPEVANLEADHGFDTGVLDAYFNFLNEAEFHKAVCVGGDHISYVSWRYIQITCYVYDASRYFKSLFTFELEQNLTLPHGKARR